MLVIQPIIYLKLFFQKKNLIFPTYDERYTITNVCVKRSITFTPHSIIMMKSFSHAYFCRVQQFTDHCIQIMESSLVRSLCLYVK